MSEKDLLSALNPEQREAVTQTEGPVLVLAGAGSGKTRVLTYRIAYIIEKGLASPQQILAVTFTNKAANEMKNRVESLLRMPVNRLWIGTFHSISARILHSEAKLAGYQSNFTIYDVADQQNQIKRIMELLNINREAITPNAVQHAISQAKNQLKDALQFEKEASDYRRKLIAQIFWEYEVALRRNNAMDFDDLLMLPIDIFTRHPEVLEKYQQRFRYILIDEYQDTNKAQYYWVKLLSQRHHNLCVVGDEDQSIYRWRGADIGNILNFEKDFPDCKVIRLEQNYRSTQTILNAANAVVSNNQNRLGKKLWSEKSGGAQLLSFQAQDEIHEAKSVVQVIQKETAGENPFSLNEIVVLYRTNAQSRALEEQLRYQGIPYSIVGGVKFYERKEIKDILAYLRFLVNPNDSMSFQRIINFPTRGIGQKTLQELHRFAFQNQLTLFGAATRVDEIQALNEGTKKRIQEFLKLMDSYRQLVATMNASEITRKIIDEIGLKRMYQKSDLVEDETRLENVNEFINSVDIFVANQTTGSSLQEYLDAISLLTDVDRWDPDKPAVTLMTLHSVKGLEFPVVIITGLEDGLFPIFRASENPEDLEEERRLFYVGMTRAKEKLYLTHALSRHRFFQGDYGSTFRSMPSRFLREIPDKLLNESFTRSYRQRSNQQKLYPDRKKWPRKQTEVLNPLRDENSKYKIGQYVQHEVFGKGQILSVNPSNLGTKLTIQFTNRTLKKLIAEYANLTICET